MKLYEFEGKKILEKHGVMVPEGVEVTRSVIASPAGGGAWQSQCASQALRDCFAAFHSARNDKFPLVVKAQVLTGKRGKNQGIFFVDNLEELQAAADRLLGSSLLGQPVGAVRIEKKLQIAQEIYLSFTYDTLRGRRPVLMLGAFGGVDIEEMAKENPSAIHSAPIDPIKGLTESQLREALLSVQLSNYQDRLIPLIFKLYSIFLDEDLRLLEINPLVRTSDGEWVAADAKAILDEDAAYRHPEWKEYSPRTIFGRPPTERELAAKKIDEGEFYYRGTASKYLEFPGDIAVMYSGGGASIVCMDALITAGGSPANYTEYSGNPPREKVYKLTKVVLAKPGLKGLWIVGGLANFTRIDETFAGIVDALEEIRPKYPIVVRRAGPYDKEGRAIMEEAAKRLGLDLTYFDRYTPMTATAKIMVEKAYAHTSV